MKLRNKILIALSPTVALSAATPALVACSKSKSYVIEYGQNINCIYKKAPAEDYGKYKSVKTIAKAIMKNTTRAPKGEVSLSTARALLVNEGWEQVLYNEIVAGMSICQEQPFTLSDWTPNTENHKIYMGWSVTPGVMTKNNFDATFTYVKDAKNNKLYLVIDPDDVTPIISISSYIFSDCTVIG